MSDLKDFEKLYTTRHGENIYIVPVDIQVFDRVFVRAASMDDAVNFVQKGLDDGSIEIHITSHSEVFKSVTSDVLHTDVNDKFEEDDDWFAGKVDTSADRYI